MPEPATAPTAPTAKACVIFLSHHTRPGAMRSLRQMTENLRGLFDVIPIFDVTHATEPLDDLPPGALCVTAEVVEAALPYRAKIAQHPGTFWSRNIDLPLLWFWSRNRHYHSYWVVEYDVRYSGNWRDFFEAFIDNPSDLLATTLFDYGFRKSWGHWQSFESPRPVPLAERVRATLSAYRLTARALQALDCAYREGCSGHYEVAIPTILKSRGFSIEDIGGEGAYVAPDNINRYYTNSPQTPGLAPGTFVLHPEGMIKDDLPNMLWNPFKD
jgi:hypothetical protein